MAAPRRRIVRPATPTTTATPIDPQVLKLRSRLATERNTLKRWMSRLRRAFRAVERAQQRITRLEKRLTQLEE